MTPTFTELEKGSTFKHVRNTKTKNQRSNLLGDLVVFTSPLADSAGKRVGRLHVQCVTTVGSSNFESSNATCSGRWSHRTAPPHGRTVVRQDGPTASCGAGR